MVFAVVLTVFRWVLFHLLVEVTLEDGACVVSRFDVKKWTSTDVHFCAIVGRPRPGGGDVCCRTRVVLCATLSSCTDDVFFEICIFHPSFVSGARPSAENLIEGNVFRKKSECAIHDNACK